MTRATDVKFGVVIEENYLFYICQEIHFYWFAHILWGHMCFQVLTKKLTVILFTQCSYLGKGKSKLISIELRIGFLECCIVLKIYDLELCKV